MLRLRLLLAGLLTFCLALGMTPGIAAAPGIDWTAVAARAVPATVNILMAKPSPFDPSFGRLVSRIVLTPITRPRASSSGPPELP